MMTIAIQQPITMAIFEAIGARRQSALDASDEDYSSARASDQSHWTIGGLETRPSVYKKNDGVWAHVLACGCTATCMCECMERQSASAKNADVLSLDIWVN